MRFSLPIIIVFILTACLSKPDCLVTATNNVKISLKKTIGNSAKKTLFTSITVSGTSTSFQSKDSVSSLVLPLNPNTDLTTFKFKYQTKINNLYINRTDSVTLAYLPQVVVISQDCGAFIYYFNLSVSSYTFEIAPRIVNSTLSTSTSIPVNLEIKL